MTTKKKKKRKQQRRIIAAALAAAAVVTGGILFFRGKYTRAGGETVSVATTELDLRNSSLTSLAELERCTELETLDVRGNELSPETVASFREKVPGCSLRWDIPVSGSYFDSDTEELTLDRLGEDWENLLLFPNLKKLTVNGCDKAEAVATLREKGVELSYNVAVDGRSVSNRTPVLTVRSTSPQDLSAALSLLPELKTIRLDGCSFSDGEKLNLRTAFPGVLFVWEIDLGGVSVQSSAATLKLSRGQISAGELTQKLALFPLLKDVDIGECGYTLEEINSLRSAFPNLHFRWTVELLGKIFSSDSTEIDLSGIKMTDTSAVEAALPSLPNLKKVIMSDCGFSDEEMDALNQRYEDIRFVWTIYFRTFSMRTDAKEWIAAKYDNWVMLQDADIRCFRYCTDLEALDLGHMAIKDLSFVQYMPHLKYLVVVESFISDLTPLAQCKELKYLEVFQCPIVDLSPLLEVKSMEDLNICYIWIPTELAFEQLSQMTWLQRLWFCGTWFTEAQKQELQEKIPDCEMDMRWGAESTGGTWRKHEHYYEMRDAFDMYYMPGGTNGLNENGEWVVNPG